MGRARSFIPACAFALVGCLTPGAEVVARQPEPAHAADGLPWGDASTSRKNLDLLTGRDVVLTLDSGEVYRGRLLGHGGGTISLRNQYAGEFEVPADKVKKVEPWQAPSPTPVAPPPPLAATPPEAVLPTQPVAPTVLAPPVPAPAPAPQPAQAAAPVAEPKFWDKIEFNLEGGLNGSQGNTDRVNLRFGTVARWTRQDDIASLEYRLVRTDDRNRTIQNRQELKGRNDWLSLSTPWTVFAEGSAEFDEFKDYDSLMRLGGGVGYRFIHDAKTTLTLRLGAGFSRKFGSTDDEYQPEGIGALDFSHRITDAQSIVVNAEYFPSLDNFDQYRTRTRAYYEIRLSDKTNLNLRFGVEHRYDTDPGRREHNDLDYAATFVLRF